MTAPENAPPVELVDAAVTAWFAASPRAALTRDQQEHFRERMRAALAAVVFRTPAAGEALADRDAAFEAVRKLLCALPRYSFRIGPHGGVKRIEDRSGNWIDFDAAHDLFDPIAVDAALSASQQQEG